MRLRGTRKTEAQRVGREAMIKQKGGERDGLTRWVRTLSEKTQGPEFKSP